jgi:UDP-glucose 4-epimerase
MKILVTGSRGYIGTKLCEQLEAEGHEVIGCDIKSRTAIEDTYYEGIELIYHLAAQTDVQYSRTHALEDAEYNIILTLKLLDKYPNVRIIYPASAASLTINSPYGLSKRVAQEYIQLLRNDYVICTLGNIWGKGGHGAIDHFMQADVIRVNGDGSQTRSIIHVDDVVRGLILAKDWETGVYSLGGNDMALKEIAEKISADRGVPVEYDLDYDPKINGEVYAAVIPNTTPNWQAEIKL